MAGIGPVKPVYKPGNSTSGKPNNQGNGKSNVKKKTNQQPNSVWEVAKNNLNNWAKNEAEQFKKHPYLKSLAYASGAAGFIPGAIGSAASGAEAYINTKINGGSDFEARRNAALTSAATVATGKAGNLVAKGLSKTKVGKAVANTTSKFLDDVNTGINNVLNPPKLAKEGVYYTPNSVMSKVQQQIHKPQTQAKGQGTAHNSAWLNGTEYPSTKERDKALVDVAKKIGYKEEQLLDTGGKVKPEVFLNKEFENIMGRPHEKEFAVAYRPGTEGFKGGRLDDSYAGSGLDNLNGEVVPGELYGHNYVGVYGLPNDPDLHYPSNPREVWQYVSGDDTGTEGILKIPQTKYFGNSEETLLNQSPEVQNGIRELMTERGYKPSDMLSIKDQKYSDVLKSVMDETGVSPNDINRYMANRYGILGNMSPYDSFGGAYPQASIGRDIDTQLFRQKQVEPYEMEERFLKARRYLKNKRGNQ